MNEVDDIVPAAFSSLPHDLVENVPQRMHDRSAKNGEKVNINLNRVAISCEVCDWFLVT
jgi:hypothetical protein